MVTPNPEWAEEALTPSLGRGTLMVEVLSFPTHVPWSPAQHCPLESWVADGELPLLLPDVQNLQEKEQHQMARKGGPN